MITVYCGIEGSLKDLKSHKIFWCISRCLFLEKSWNFTLQKSFSLVFTSRFSVFAFAQQKFFSYDNKINWQMCEAIGAVGKNTAQLISSEPVFKLFFPKIKKIVFPTHENGLRPLLMLPNVFKENSDVFILTSLEGKTKQVLSELQITCQFRCIDVPVYKTIDMETIFHQKFLDELFLIHQSSNSEFFFVCRSGQILRKALFALTQYFKVNLPKELPPFLFFSTWDGSVAQALEEFDLVDRIRYS